MISGWAVRKNRAQHTLIRDLLALLHADPPGGAARGRAGLPEGVREGVERGGWAPGSRPGQAQRGVPGRPPQIPGPLPQCVPTPAFPGVSGATGRGFSPGSVISLRGC